MMKEGYAADAELDKYIHRPNGLHYHEQQIYVPNHASLRQDILYDHHNSPCAGYLGQARTLELIRRQFFWLTLVKDAKEYVNSCEECQRNKPSQQVCCNPSRSLIKSGMLSLWTSSHSCHRPKMDMMRSSWLLISCR